MNDAGAVTEADVVALVTRLSAEVEGFLTELGPLILAALALGLTRDSRAMARMFDAAHALVLRECVHLEADLGLVVTEDRGERSGRLFLALSAAGAAATGAALTGAAATGAAR